MKKIKVLVLVLALMIGTQAVTSAIQTQNIEEQKIINQNAAEQLQAQGVFDIVKKIDELTGRYVNNMRECQPLHVHQYLDLFGLKISYKIDVNGWVDNKCAYSMTGNVGGIGKDIREVFGIKVSDEAIAKIEPVINCNFSKEELNVLVDGFISMQQRKEEQLQKMLSSEEKYINALTRKKAVTKLSPAEEKMIGVIAGGACTIPNQEELMKNFTDVFMGQEFQEQK